MSTAKTAFDPLWQCLCPSWMQVGRVRSGATLSRVRRPAAQCQNLSNTALLRTSRSKIPQAHDSSGTAYNFVSFPLAQGDSRSRANFRNKQSEIKQYETESISTLYAYLSSAAINGQTRRCQEIAKHLVRERREEPNLAIYNALIMCNVAPADGSVKRVHELLAEMEAEGIQLNAATCHAVLKVLSVHLDHLLRSEILEYMHKRWYTLSEDGAHDVTAGLFRDGLFEQALENMDKMRRSGTRIEAWLLDMAFYILCEAGEIDVAYNIILSRHTSGEQNINRSAWAFLLDKASEACHHAATSLAWNSQVNQDYLNPSSGTCLNVLHTASRAGDTTLAAAVFSHLGKRGTAFEPIHFELLISAHLSSDPPDLSGALAALTLMPLENLAPTAAETRALCTYLREHPHLVPEALGQLHDLRERRERKIPIAAINMLIECQIETAEGARAAMKMYKALHTLALPSGFSGDAMAAAGSTSFADVETFNLLLKGCRNSSPPDTDAAEEFLSEMRALGIREDKVTYDRLILVFERAADELYKEAKEPQQRADGQSSALSLLERALVFLEESIRHGHMPRPGTLNRLAHVLAARGDERCWDILQLVEDRGDEIEGHERNAGLIKGNVEKAWEKAMASRARKEVKVVSATHALPELQV